MTTPRSGYGRRRMPHNNNGNPGLIVPGSSLKQATRGGLGRKGALAQYSSDGTKDMRKHANDTDISFLENELTTQIYTEVSEPPKGPTMKLPPFAYFAGHQETKPKSKRKKNLSQPSEPLQNLRAQPKIEEPRKIAPSLKRQHRPSSFPQPNSVPSSRGGEDSFPIQVPETKPATRAMESLYEPIPKRKQQKTDNQRTDKRSVDLTASDEEDRDGRQSYPQQSNQSSQKVTFQRKSSTRFTVETSNFDDNQPPAKADAAAAASNDNISVDEDSDDSFEAQVSFFDNLTRSATRDTHKMAEKNRRTFSFNTWNEKKSTTARRGSYGGSKNKTKSITPGASIMQAAPARLSEPAQRMTRRSTTKISDAASKMVDLVDEHCKSSPPLQFDTTTAKLCRIAIGEKVFREDCNVLLCDGKLELRCTELCSKSTRTRRSSVTEKQHEVYLKLLDLKKIRYHETEDPDASYRSFLSLTVDASAYTDIAKTCPDYDSSSDSILLEFETGLGLINFVNGLGSHGDYLKQKIEMGKIDCVDEANDCLALTYDFESQKTKPKARTKTRDVWKEPNFLAGKLDDEVLLVYPFAGDKESIDKAAEGFMELDYFRRIIVDEDASEQEANGNGAPSNGRSHVLTISAGDCRRLGPGVYLNDTLIDFFMRWMSRHEPEDSLTHYFSTHFYTTLAEKGVERVQRWNARKGIDIFKKRLVFIPINKYLHWSLAVIVNPGAIENYKTRDPDAPFPLILFFDSLNMHTKSRVGTNLRKWIAAEWNRRLGMSDNEGANKDLFTRDSMRLYSPKGVPGQQNGYDCGVFVCRNAFGMTRLKDFNFSTAEIGDDNARNSFFRRKDVEICFQYDNGDIDRLRDELLQLLGNLSPLYQSWKEEQTRQKAVRKHAARGDNGLLGSPLKSSQDSEIQVLDGTNDDGVAQSMPMDCTPDAPPSDRADSSSTETEDEMPRSKRLKARTDSLGMKSAVKSSTKKFGKAEKVVAEKSTPQPRPLGLGLTKVNHPRKFSPRDTLERAQKSPSSGADCLVDTDEEQDNPRGDDMSLCTQPETIKTSGYEQNRRETRSSTKKKKALDVEVINVDDDDDDDDDEPSLSQSKVGAFRPDDLMDEGGATLQIEEDEQVEGKFFVDL